MNKHYVLDTSAFLAMTCNEQGSSEVEAILNLARRQKASVYVSFVTFTEIYYTIFRQQGEAAAQETISLLNVLPIEKVHSNDVLALSAGRIKSKHRLSLGDAFVAATALEKKAILVHKDPEFFSLASEISILSLPFKLKVS